MRREIGSEFWNVPAGGALTSFFQDNTQWFLSGRSALQSIIRELKGLHTVAMPSLCCESMITPFLDAGMTVRFYPVYPNHGLTQELDTSCDVLFLMDFFGYTSGTTAVHPCVIRDVTHSIFSHRYTDADYTFGSLRKWCGFWTGGFAWSKDGSCLETGDGSGGDFPELRKRAMELKERYIFGSQKEAQDTAALDKGYLAVFEEAENLLDHCGIAPAEERDVYLAKRLNVDGIRDQRRRNARILMEAFPEQLLFPEIGESDCPMFVPLLVPDGKRNQLRDYLKEKKIFCPIHWPVSTCHKLDARERTIYDNEISLVCDQRYSEEDMEHIVNVIERFWEEI